MRPEDFRSLVDRYFTVAGMHYDEESIFFPIAGQPSDDQLERNFDALRRELIPKGYIPMLLKDQGELGVYISRKPMAKYRSPVVNLLMLFATIATTVFAGLLTWASYEGIPLFSQRAFLLGSLFFALPLMLILGTHELSHYLAARRHGVAASLPFFLPAPPPFGTFGAFISIRDPIPDRKALMDIGVAGPVAGFIMTIFVTIAGIWLTSYFHIPVAEDAGGLVYLGSPMLFDVIWNALGPAGNYMIHPTAFAGWVGFLVTSLNLLPAGQLDGGHIARALLGEKSRYAGYASIVALLIFMVVFQYYGWMLFIFLIIFLGLYHPPPLNDLTKLDGRRKGLGALAVFILVVAFIPVPMIQVEPEYGVKLVADRLEGNVEVNGSLNYTFYVENTGNTGATMVLVATFPDPEGRDAGWNVTLPGRNIQVPASGYRELNLTVISSSDIPLGNRSVVNLTVYPEASSDQRRHLEFTTVAGFVLLRANQRFNYALPPAGQTGAPQALFNVTVINLVNGTRPASVNLSITGGGGWDRWPGGNFSVEVNHGRDASFELLVRPPPGTPVGSRTELNLLAEEEGNSSRAASLTLTVEMGQVRAVKLSANITSLVLLPGESATVGITVNNTGNGPDTFNHTASAQGLLLEFPSEPVFLESGAGTTINMTIRAISRGQPVVTVKFFSARDPLAMDQVLIQVNVE